MKIRFVLLYLFIIINLCFAQGAKYLIITHDNFYNAIQPLARWKHKKGMPTKVVKLSEIGATPTSISVIKNYIVNAYNTWTPRPEYVLLVGNGTYLRAESNLYDDYYGNVTGDMRMEISIGRFPVGTALQCSINVAKTLGYERTPYLTDTTWYRKSTTIVREDGTTHPDTVYWNDARYAHSCWINASYTNIDSLSRLRGSNSTSVTNAINNGRTFVLYRGTATTTWYNPFQQVNPNNMTNGFKLPIIVSATCATMDLYYTDYLGDRFMNAGTVLNPKGAVGFFGTTISTYGNGLARLRGTVTQSFFNAVFNQRIYKLGDAAKRAKFVIDSIRPPYFTTDRYREWNLFGDPELNLWTTRPRTLTVQHDTSIQTIPQNFNVTVRNQTQPLANALVCIMMDTLIYQYGYTDASGNISFFVHPNSTGSISVTVTAQNFIPYEQNISVRYGSLNHDVGILSIIEPTGVINSSVPVIPKVKVKNYGSVLDTFVVAMNIGTIYSQVVEDVILAPNDTITVAFPEWISVPGNYLVLAYTDLEVDQFRANDTAITTVLVNISNDVGIDLILAPDTSHPVNVAITPRARIKNYGVLTQTNFTVTCSIIGSNGIVQYANTQTVAALTPHDTITLDFMSWTPTISQLCTVKFRTNLINDENPSNDQKVRLTNMFTGIYEQTINNIVPTTSINNVKPNPISHNHTHIAFSLSQTMPVTLKIYDASGAVVKTLVNQTLHQGIHTCTWNAKDELNRYVPEGIYFLSLHTSEKNYTKKLILSR
ncbi:MAG: T9SS type A sorting domain-containing protein [Candidatus Latescibacteria bacterium]|nr:T9SS type A sorting domain-containing protein [Candidatus Latescibacterota bacterium]